MKCENTDKFKKGIACGYHMQSNKCLNVFGAFPQLTLQSANLIQARRRHESTIINQNIGMHRETFTSYTNGYTSLLYLLKTEICKELIYFTNENSRQLFVLL